MLLLLVGCEPQPHVAPQPPVELGPEERLELVLHRFRSRCTATDTTLSIPDEGGRRERMRVKVEFDSVTHQLHAPATADDKYTAEVTVQSSTYLSVVAPPPLDPEQSDAEAKAPTPEGLVDPLLETERKRREREQAERGGPNDPQNIARREQHTVTYDLAYEHERWVLKSQNVDPSVQLMFDYALAGQ